MEGTPAKTLFSVLDCFNPASRHHDRQITTGHGCLWILDPRMRLLDRGSRQPKSRASNGSEKC